MRAPMTPRVTCSATLCCACYRVTDRVTGATYHGANPTKKKLAKTEAFMRLWEAWSASSEAERGCRAPESPAPSAAHRVCDGGDEGAVRKRRFTEAAPQSETHTGPAHVCEQWRARCSALHTDLQAISGGHEVMLLASHAITAARSLEQACRPPVSARPLPNRPDYQHPRRTPTDRVPPGRLWPHP